MLLLPMSTLIPHVPVDALSAPSLPEAPFPASTHAPASWAQAWATLQQSPSLLLEALLPRPGNVIFKLEDTETEHGAATSQRDPWSSSRAVFSLPACPGICHGVLCSRQALPDRPGPVLSPVSVKCQGAAYPSPLPRESMGRGWLGALEIK
jgi:hypothetical protein